MPPDNTEHNRRRFHRILFDAPVAITHNQTDNRCQSTVIDISLKGALIALPSDWAGEAGTDVSLDIQLSDDKTHICMQGSITHVTNQHLGIQCHQIDIDSISHLRRLAALNTGDADMVERELTALG
ncbi:hypothetical protein MNBD_GAMMA26-1445 [hydrothermal vent metagenome]|uniref:PilZ domain-containing protein n=1 Tax=hydrothermal vent metagenome TaxID=652676 RepID=A0A3B1ATS1_9ZZZZ